MKNFKRILCFTVVLTIAMIAGVFVLNTNAKEEHTVEKYYTSISIEKGDTLSSIAEEFNDIAIQSNQKYMEEVMEINHLTSDKIQYGQYLTVPYFSADLP